tara:strand:- start:443 stop:9625 length:9183 start_codon:yes stop_codon:yes gene_type:complete
MPLPDNYFDLVNNQKRSENRLTPSTGIYRDLTPDVQTPQGGNAWDFLGSTLWGATSGVTWGLSELAGLGPQKKWEDMNSWERAGWVVGEGGSFFIPYVGPFAAVGKGLSKVAKVAGNPWVKKAVTKAATSSFDNISRDTAEIVTKQINKLSQQQNISIDQARKLFSDDILTGLNKVAKDDMSVQWMKDMHVAGDASRRASANLLDSSSYAIRKAFDDNGVKLARSESNQLAQRFVDDLGEGKYVNDVAEWVERILGGSAPGKLREVTSKYLGMAAQDMLLMTIHGLGSGKIKALAHGEDFDPMESLSHSAIMALSFPLIRAIPGGGKDNLTTGIKNVFRNFKNTNYKALQDAHGEEVVRNLARVMLRGQNKDLFSRSSLANTSWKIGGKEYMGGSEILKDLSKMPMNQVRELLKKMNAKVNNDLLRMWGPKYAIDLVQSIPRMGVGLVSMNPWILNKDAWGTMEGPELGSHLFMAAIMTKGRGAWGRDAKRAYFAEFTPYMEALRTLGVNTKNIENVVRMKERKADIMAEGSTLYNNKVTREIEMIFDEAIKASKSLPTGRDWNNIKHSRVAEFKPIYDLIQTFKDPSIDPTKIKVQHLDAKTLEAIGNRLNKVIVRQNAQGKDLTVGDLGFQRTMTEVNKITTKEMSNTYKEMLLELSFELGFPISQTKGVEKLTAGLAKGVEGTDYGNSMMVNEALIALNKLGGIVDVSKAKDVDIAKLIQKSRLRPEEFDRRVSEIVDKYMDILGKQYGDDLKATHPVFDVDGTTPNHYFKHMAVSKNVDAVDRLLRIVEGNPEIQTDKVFLEAFDNIFRMKDGRFAESIDEYLLKGIDPNAQKGSKEFEMSERMIFAKEVLRPIFELRKTMLRGRSGDKSTKEISSNDMEALMARYEKDIYRDLPADMKNLETWYGSTRELMMEQIFKIQGADPRAINLLHYLRNNNWAIESPADGKLTIPDLASVKKMARDTQDPKVMEKALESHRLITEILGDFVQQGDFVFDAVSRSKNVETVPIETLTRVVDFLGNRTVNDLMGRAKDLSSDIKNMPLHGLRKDLKDLDVEINTVLEGVDPSRKVKVTDPIGKIDEISKRLGQLVTQVSSRAGADSGQIKDPVVRDQINDIITRLNLLKTDINKESGKWEGTFENRLTEQQKQMGDVYGFEQYLGKPIQTILHELIRSEAKGINLLDKSIVRLNTALLQSKNALTSIDKAEAQMLVDKFVVEWNQLYRGKNAPKVELSELIEQVNNGGSFRDGIKIIEKLNQSIDRAVAFGKENHPLNHESIKSGETLHEGNKIHEHHRSVQEILRDNNLLGVDGNPKKDFLADITTATNADQIQRALETHVRDFIFQNDKISISEKDKTWNKFLEKDASELIMNLVNSSPIKKVNIAGVTQKANERVVLQFENEASAIGTPGNQWFKKQGYEVFHLTDAVSYLRNGKLRNQSIDTEVSPDAIQQYIADGFRVNKANRDVIKAMESVAEPFEIGEILKTPQDNLIYARVSPRNKVVFVRSKKNLERLDKNFETWYDKTLRRYENESGVLATEFKRVFGHLKNKANDTRSDIELKLMMMYLESQGSRRQFDLYVQALRDPALNSTNIAQKMYKIANLSDGGTTQPESAQVNNWLTKYHPDVTVRGQAARELTNKGDRVIIGNDGPAESKDNYRNQDLSIRRIVENAYNDIVVDPNTPKDLRRIMRKSFNELNEIESLDNSLFDGVKFLSYGKMIKLMAQKGMLNNDFMDSPNGAKTVIFAVDGVDANGNLISSNQLLGKGYSVYHPEVSKFMTNAGADIFIPTTSAKDYSGVNLNGTKLKTLDLSRGVEASLNLGANTRSLLADYTMTIPTGSMGVSFTSKNAKKINLSPSIFDLQNSLSVDQARTFMRIDQKISDINREWGSLHGDGGKLARYMYEVQEESGNFMEQGEAGVIKTLFRMGADPNNVIVSPALRRIVREGDFRVLKQHAVVGGEDNFITPNVLKDLSNPLNVKVFNSEGNQLTRRSMQHGGIKFNTNTLKNYQLGDYLEAGTTSLKTEKFIFRDENGVDIVISKDRQNNFRYASSLYDAIDSKGTLRLKGVDSKGAESEIAISKKSLKSKSVEQALESIEKIVSRHSLNGLDLVKLLKGEKITKDGFVLDFTKQKFWKTIKDQNIELANMSHAIPNISHDKVVFRIQGYSEGMDGLVEVNSYDLRTALQRDNDGDHLYSHNKLPWESFKGFLKENGQKTDFYMFNKSESLTRELLNPFGIGEQGQAGEVANNVGFHEYSNKLHNSKMIIGTVVGARSAIGWMNRVGFQARRKPTDKFENYTENLIDVNLKDLAILDKFMDTVQNSVDIHGGKHPIMADKTLLENFIFFGEVPSSLNTKAKESLKLMRGDLSFAKHVDNAANLLSGNFNKNIRDSFLKKEIFKEIIRTLKQANKVNNETWDERGQRVPEPDELKDYYYDIKRLFENPTTYLASKMRRKIFIANKYESSELANRLKSEYFEIFFPDSRADLYSAEKKSRYFDDIRKGLADQSMNKIFNWKGITGIEGYKAAFKESIAGYTLSRILENKHYWDWNYEGMRLPREIATENKTNLYDGAGYFVRNMESYIETRRAFGESHKQIIDDVSRGDYVFDATSFGNKNGRTYKNMLNAGILNTMLNKQHANLVNRLEYFNSQPFTDPMKINKLVDRLHNIQTGINIMGITRSKGMLLENPNIQIIQGPKNRSMRFASIQKLGLKPGQRVAIYSLKGDVKITEAPDTKDKSFWNMVTQSTSEGDKQIPFNQLKFIGYYGQTKDGYKNRVGSLRLRKGYTYIVDKNPNKYGGEYLDANSAKYADALFEATTGYDMLPESFLKENVGQFVEQARNVRASLNYGQVSTNINAMSNVVLKDMLYAVESSRQIREIDQLVSDFRNSVKDKYIPEDAILNYLIQPQPIANQFYGDYDGGRPVFKTNVNLVKKAMMWANKSGREGWTQRIVRDMEAYARGEQRNPDASPYDRMYSDGIDYDALGNKAGMARTLSKYQGFFFHSIYLDKIMEGAAPKGRGQEFVLDILDNVNGDTKIGIRRENKVKSFHENEAKNNPSEGGC